MPDPKSAQGILRHRAVEALGIAALALVLNLAGNSRVGLWDRDEPRYAECTREMRISGDYLRPTFNGQPRHQKPVLIYWLMLLGTAVGGDNPFGVRLVSACAGASTCVMVWAFGRKMFGPQVGRLAALVLATAPIVVINSKLATTDATLAFFLATSQFALWTLSKRPSRAASYVFWVSLALATLTKGPVGPALIAASGVVSLAFGGPRECWGRLRWKQGLATFVLIAAPWYLAIGILSRGDFYRVAIGGEIVGRVTKVLEQHPGFPGYYPTTTLLAFYPWSTLLPAAFLAAIAKRKSDPTLGFLLGWAFGPMIVLECVRTKLVHYYLPAYPACALIVAWLVSKLGEAEMSLRRWPLGRLGSGLLSGVAVSLTILAVGAALVLPWSLTWPCLLIAALFVIGTSFASQMFRQARPERGAMILAGTWACVMLVLGGWLLPAAEPYRLPRRVAKKLAEVADRSKNPPILMGFQEPSLIYSLGRPVSVMRDGPWLRDALVRDGSAVSAVSHDELDKLAKDPGLTVDVIETIDGFHMSKGKSESLSVVVIRPTEVARRSVASGTRVR